MTDFKEKTILITGGTGSFGGYFVNYLLDKKFKEVRIYKPPASRKDSKESFIICKFLG